MEWGGGGSGAQRDSQINTRGGGGATVFCIPRPDSAASISGLFFTRVESWTDKKGTQFNFAQQFFFLAAVVVELQFSSSKCHCTGVQVVNS